jgi:hypothetical protein
MMAGTIDHGSELLAVMTGKSVKDYFVSKIGSKAKLETPIAGNLSLRLFMSQALTRRGAT